MPSGFLDNLGRPALSRTETEKEWMVGWGTEGREDLGGEQEGETSARMQNK